LLVVVVEFLHHSIAPRLGHGNKPGFHPLVQAESNQRPRGCVGLP
jgi:hypothetical protein